MGGLLGCVVITALLIHILRHYFKIFGCCFGKKTAKQKDAIQSPMMYWLMIVFLATGLIIAFSFSFVRSNIITHVPAIDYTDAHCMAGYYLAWETSGVSKSVMYNLFNYRIQIAFQGTPFAYNRRLYNLLYIS